MKPTYFLAGAVIVAALVAGFAGYHSECDPALHRAARAGDTMGWLRQEFHLNESQFDSIHELHRAYLVVCEEHCRAIRATMAERATLQQTTPQDTHALAAIDQRLHAVEAACERALLLHLEQVASVMSPEDGRRYLETTRPMVAKFDHSAAPNLDLSPRLPRHGGH